MLKHPMGYTRWTPAMLFLAFAVANANAKGSIPGYDEVKQELATRGKTVVLIQLRGEEKRFGSFEERNADIHAVQGRVLARLAEGLQRTPSSVFNLRYPYKTIYGMTAEMDLSALDLLAQDPEAANVAADREVRAHTTESGPVIGADIAQGLGYTGSGITVAVLDTGIDTDNVDLADDLVGQKSFLSEGTVGTSAEDGNGHGTNVCGIITSKGSAAPKGIAPDAKIVAVKVLSDGGLGFLSDWIAGVDWVVQQKQAATFTNLRVINMSLGSSTLYSSCPCDSESENSLMSASITSAKTNGIFVAVSSGNLGNTTQMAAPACLMDAVSVGATYDSDLGREPDDGTYQSHFGSGFGDCSDSTTGTSVVTCFTNRNSCLTLLAPGSRITSTFNTGATNIYYTGTSQASPHVAAAAAILFQKMGASTAPADIKSWLVSHGVSVSDSATGLTFPRINLSDLSASAVPAIGWIGLMVLAVFLGWRLRERRFGRNIRLEIGPGKT